MVNDTTLILEAQRGNVKAFESLVHRYDERVLSMALSYSGDPDEAKDIYQEVFLRAYRALPKFEHRSQFATWLYRIAVNVCKTHYNRRTRRQFLSLDSPLRPGDSEGRLEDRLQAGDPTDHYALASDFAQQMEQALESLSPKQKLVFCLRHYHGHKLKEIAEIMECAEGTVKRHLFTAVRRLREQLAPLVDEGWHP